MHALYSTLHAANSACNYVSTQAWSMKSFEQYGLHHLCYKGIRTRFCPSAQAAVRVISTDHIAAAVNIRQAAISESIVARDDAKTGPFHGIAAERSYNPLDLYMG